MCRHASTKVSERNTCGLQRCVHTLPIPAFRCHLSRNCDKQIDLPVQLRLTYTRWAPQCSFTNCIAPGRVVYWLPPWPCCQLAFPQTGMRLLTVCKWLCALQPFSPVLLVCGCGYRYSFLLRCPSCRVLLITQLLSACYRSPG